MSGICIEEIGCCGAYCKTCRSFIEKVCSGCKTGYLTSERDISKAKCKMKVCCIKRKLSSCADCEEYTMCRIIQEFYKKNGYKYGKYKEAVEYIRNNGYEQFIIIASKWGNAYGKFN